MQVRRPRYDILPKHIIKKPWDIGMKELVKCVCCPLELCVFSLLPVLWVSKTKSSSQSPHMNTLCRPLRIAGSPFPSLGITICTEWATRLPLILQRRPLCVKACEEISHASGDTLRPWVSSIGETIKDSGIKKHMQIVLFSPQIAGNTGSIARTCAASSVGLHLIEPLGFQIDDAKLKRAGLDYWPYVFVKVHASWREFMDFFKQQEGEKRLVAFTKRGTCLYTEKKYKPGDWLVFGAETTGLSPEALQDCADEQNYGGGKVRIPMVDTYVRSLNLAVSVGIGVYEALRQLNVLGNISCQNSDSQEMLPELPEEIIDAHNLEVESPLHAMQQ